MRNHLLVLAASILSACASSASNDEPHLPPRALHVGVLIVDGVSDSEMTASIDVFEHTGAHAQPGMKVFTVGPTLDPVHTAEGLRVLPDYTLVSAPPIDVLVVPGAQHSTDADLENAELVQWVRTTGLRAQFVVSLSDGAFVLAKAGLLDSRAATAFPADVARFRETFGTVKVHGGVSFVHDGALVTSAGGARSYDAALYVCERIYGEEVTRAIAKGLVIDWDVDEVAHVER